MMLWKHICAQRPYPVPSQIDWQHIQSSERLTSLLTPPFATGAKSCVGWMVVRAIVITNDLFRKHGHKF
ncbi:TPA: hypothetical protein ACWX3Z_004693, partial [Escherichia coli]